MRRIIALGSPAHHVVQSRDVPGADGQVFGVAHPIDGVPEVDHPARLVVVELGAGTVLGQEDQRLDENVVEPLRVLPQFPGQDLGLLLASGIGLG